jgi:hypothetical protein
MHWAPEVAVTDIVVRTLETDAKAGPRNQPVLPGEARGRTLEILRVSRIKAAKMADYPASQA